MLIDRLPARPEHATLDDLSGLRHVEVPGSVAERAVEYLSRSPTLLPDHRDGRALDPGRVLLAEGRGRQHLVVLIHVHVVLLGAHPEAFEPGGYGVLAVHDVDLVVDDATGVCYELSANHELVVRVVAERVGQATVPAGEADPALDRLQQSPLLFVGDLPHAPDLYHQVEGLHLLLVQVGVERARGFDLVPFSSQEGSEDARALLGLVALPPAADE